MAKQTWELISYDLWGNQEDGFEVNAAYRTGKVIEFDSNLSDSELESLVSEWVGFRVELDSNNCDSEQLYFLESGESWKPAFELQQRKGD